MRQFKIVLGGLIFAAAIAGFAGFTLAIAQETFAPLPGFEDNSNPIPTPTPRPRQKVKL